MLNFYTESFLFHVVIIVATISKYHKRVLESDTFQIVFPKNIFKKNSSEQQHDERY